MLTFHIVTLFPEAIEPYLAASLLGKARQKKLISYDLVQLRKFSRGRHKKVDDKPYGGGPGMVLMVDPIYNAVKNIREKIYSPIGGRKGRGKKPKTRIILFSTRGKTFNQQAARRFSKYDHLILLCGRYEGVDERVAKHIADEEVSMGEYVLSGGELPALVLVEAVSRHIPGVLGKHESLEELKGSYPVYTRPDIFTPSGRRVGKWKVPDVLISGNHAKIEAWRRGKKRARLPSGQG